MRAPRSAMIDERGGTPPGIFGRDIARGGGWGPTTLSAMAIRPADTASSIGSVVRDSIGRVAAIACTSERVSRVIA